MVVLALFILVPPQNCLKIVCLIKKFIGILKLINIFVRFINDLEIIGLLIIEKISKDLLSSRFVLSLKATFKLLKIEIALFYFLCYH